MNVSDRIAYDEALLETSLYVVSFFLSLVVFTIYHHHHLGCAIPFISEYPNAFETANEVEAEVNVHEHQWHS